VTHDKVSPQENRAPERELVVDSVVSGGAAAKAGVQRGDVIIKAAGQDVCCRLELERQMAERAVGDTLALEVRRNGLDKQLSVALAESEKGNPAATDVAWHKLGLKLHRVGADAVNQTNKQLQGGLLIEEVRNESSAARAGLQRGDVLVGLHQWEMLSLDNVAFVLTHPDLTSFSPLRFFIVRGGQVHRGYIQVAE